MLSLGGIELPTQYYYRFSEPHIPNTMILFQRIKLCLRRWISSDSWTNRRIFLNN